MKKRLFAAVAAAVLLLSSCAGEARRRGEIYGTFDTVIEVITSLPQAETDRFTALAKEKLEEWNKLTDAYHPYEGVNGIYAINHSGGKPVPAEEKLLDLLTFGMEAYRETGGTIDLTCGAVTRLWKDVDAPPSEAAVTEALRHVGIENLVIDREKNTVCLLDPDAALDVGAFAKGYALQQVAKELQTEGFRGVLSATSSVVAVGDNAAIGISDPKNGGYDRVLTLRDTALATAGTNQRFFEYQGRKYHHIIDLSDGFPSDSGVIQASIVCEDAGWADVYATAAVIDGHTERDGLLYDAEGTIHETGKIKELS